MPNGTYGGVRGRKTKVGRKLSFSSYSIIKSTLNIVNHCNDYNYNISFRFTVASMTLTKKYDILR